MDITSFILGYKKGIASAGSGETTHPVHTVTFMSEDGSAVLYQRSVVDGDTCADVVARGLLETPTKDSTAQYNYTYSGWSLTSGGVASSSALTSVTEDRTVYAAFMSAVRYYTITFYDSDGTTELATAQVAYGVTPTIDNPTKDGYSFNGWSPELEPVTGDASYTAIWLEKITFANGSWADISRVCEAGEAESYFTVNDTREISFTDTEGRAQTATFKIIGFNHDDKADGSGKAGITVAQITNCDYMYLNRAKKTYNSKTGYYAGGWLNSDIRAELNSDVLASMPADLQSVIKSVKKVSSVYVDGTTKSTQETEDKLWIPSAAEMGLSSNSTYYIEVESADAYESYPKANITNSDGDVQTAVTTRTGSYYRVDNASFWRNTTGTAANGGTAGTSKYGSICFCI